MREFNFCHPGGQKSLFRGFAGGPGPDPDFPAGGAIAGLTDDPRTALIQFLFSGRFEPLAQGRPALLRAFRQTARSVVVEG
jgi:hypothetical protein